MLSRFLNYFGEYKQIDYSGDLYADLIKNFGGKSFGHGLFNIFSSEEVGKWTELVTEGYPFLKNRFKIFAYDWLGRCFAIDMNEKNYGNVLMFEIGTAQILGIPCNLEVFLNEEIPEYSDACLAKPFFEEYMEYAKKEIGKGRCAGYKIPLFLGGEDVVENLEDSDMEVYWSITSAIAKEVRS